MAVTDYLKNRITKKNLSPPKVSSDKEAIAKYYNLPANEKKSPIL